MSEPPPIEQVIAAAQREVAEAERDSSTAALEQSSARRGALGMRVVILAALAAGSAGVAATLWLAPAPSANELADGSRRLLDLTAVAVQDQLRHTGKLPASAGELLPAAATVHIRLLDDSRIELTVSTPDTGHVERIVVPLTRTIGP